MTWVCTWDKPKFSHLHNIFYVARYFTGAVLLLVKAETKLSLVPRSLQHSSLSVWHSAHTVSDKHYSRSGSKPKQTTWIQQLWTYQLWSGVPLCVLDLGGLLSTGVLAEMVGLSHACLLFLFFCEETLQLAWKRSIGCVNTCHDHMQFSKRRD